MARLLVLRGDSLEQEIRLTGGTVRIGRGPHNELVLDDPGRSVSREHAEIRYEGGRYAIYDLDSQNGVWAAGARAPYIALDPDVVATIGPFRLMVDAGADTGVHGGGASDGDTYYSEPDPMAHAGGAPPVGRPAGAAGTANWMAQHGKWIAGGCAAIVIGGIGFGMSRLLRPNEEPAVPPRLEKAVALLNAGDCAGALEELAPVLAAEPTDAAALKYKAQADACTKVADGTTAVMSADELAAHLAAARDMIAAGNCAAALSEHIEPVLAADGTNADALALNAQASVCPSPAPRGGGTDPGIATGSSPGLATGSSTPADCPGPVARPLPPQQGGVRLAHRCESQAEYDARAQAMRARYDDALVAIAAGAHQRAAGLLEGIVRDAGDRYRDAAARLAELRGKDAAARALAAAQDHESRNELDRALAEYRRARDADPSPATEAHIARVTALRATLGEAACKEANTAVAYSRNAEALQAYQTVVKMLPPDHECVVKAKERFPQLRK